MSFSKYKAKPVVIDGIRFPSIKQGNRYKEIKLMERAGQIRNLCLEVPYIICPAVVINGKKSAARKYVADFVYEENGKEIVEDCKGMRTKEYILKRHFMKHVHGIDILET